MAHFLSVDLEDWHHSAFLRNYVNEINLKWRIDVSTNLILDLFQKLNVRATFFILGEVALKFPGLIERIKQEGHEVASHGFNHIPLWDLNKESFKNELIKTNDILSTITGERVLGFRAPYASLRQETAWAIDVLTELQFLYDSSVFPIKTPLYGVKNAPLGIYKISSECILKNDKNSQLLEIPFTIYKNWLLSIPITGGIYGRFIPYAILIFLLKLTSKKRTINFYFHPWEIDMFKPKINIKMKDKIISYYGVHNYLPKIEKIIKTNNFNTFKFILENTNNLEIK